MATTLQKLAVKVVDDLFNSYPTLFPNASKTVYQTTLSSALEDIVSKDIELSRTEPDYEQVMLQLHATLSEDPDWYDILTAGTGQTLLRMIASGIAYDQFSIMRAYQETYIQYAASDNSIFSATRMLGVRPRRKLPGSVSVTFTRPDKGSYLEIPAYSSFKINNLDFFNRNKIVFKASDLTVDGFLYQGQVEEEIVESNGEPFQKFHLGNGARTAADNDVQITIANVVWEKINDGPWLLSKQGKQYYESTAANGDVEIEFGNGDYGYIPDVSKPINIKWVQTMGKSGNLDVSGLAVTWSDAPSGVTVTGITTTNCEGGDNEISASVYRKIAPNLRAANKRAVRRSDYKTQAINFAGVKDALFRGQAELAPGRRSMMNVIGVTLLTDSSWSNTQFTKFEEDFKEQLGVFQTQFLRIDPTALTMDIKADVYCRPDAVLSEIKAEVTVGIEELFEPKLDHLGYNIYRTDISDILNGRRKNSPSEKLERSIEYCILDPSVNDLIMPDKTYYAKLGTLTLNFYYTTRGGFAGRLDLSTTNLNDG